MRDVTMHIAIDAQHVWPLRQALIKDCAGQAWSISVAVLPGGARMRVSLTLPRLAVGHALDRIGDVAPGAEVRQFVEVPENPSCAWNDLVHVSNARQAQVAGALQPLAIPDVLDEDNVLLDFEAADVPSLFDRLALVASRRYGVDARVIADGLASREALGTTGLGQGVAVPHARIGGIPREIALYVRPATPVQFDAPDGQPVTDVLCLLLPDWGRNAHLHLLASGAQFFCDRRFRRLLRSCENAGSVCQLFSTYVPEAPEAPKSAAP